MEVVGYLYGGAAYRVKYQINETIPNIGVPLLAAGNSGADAGLALPSGATDVADMVGVNYDTATYVTAQQTDGSTAERTVTVDIRPDCVIKALLSGGSSENTALPLYDITTDTTDGLDVTTGDSWSNFDGGTVWAYDGVNAGQSRKLTTVSSTVGTVTVAFENDHVVGDNFLRASVTPFDLQSEPSLTAAFYQVNAEATSGESAEFGVLKLVGKTVAEEGRTTSYVLLVPHDHYLNQLAQQS